MNKNVNSKMDKYKLDKYTNKTDVERMLEETSWENVMSRVQLSKELEEAGVYRALEKMEVENPSITSGPFSRLLDEKVKVGTDFTTNQPRYKKVPRSFKKTISELRINEFFENYGKNTVKPKYGSYIEGQIKKAYAISKK